MYIFWGKSQKYNFKDTSVLDQYISKTLVPTMCFAFFFFKLMATMDEYLDD